MQKILTATHHDNRTDTSDITFPLTQYKRDPLHKMHALQYFGKKDLRMKEVQRPMITEPGDAIVRITTTAICGSDLHLYHSEFQGLEKGDILGHEFMGIVEDVGSDVKNLNKGDRVVVSFCIACGECEYCKRQEFSVCDRTNPSKTMEKLYGHRTAGIFGYSKLLGGYEGGQAEYARVPLADNNCLKVPSHLKDEQVLFLSDIACTAWHANVLANVQQGDNVAIWGAGPVGLLAAMWAKQVRGANRVILIDNVPHRLELARENLGVETINFNEKDVVNTIHEIMPGGPDCALECAGFRYSKGWLHKIERAVGLETDTPEILNEIITCVRKNGRIGVVGDYYSYTNHFNIGAFMEKSLHMSAGQCFVQKYWNELLRYIEEGKCDPTFVISHTLPLEQAAEGYRIFDEEKNTCVKVILKPSTTSSATA